MPAALPPTATQDRKRLALLGERIRLARKRQRVSAVAAAQAAGVSRVTLHRVERGEPSVAIGAWIAIATALGLSFDLLGSQVRAAKVPKRVRLRDFPELEKLAWQLHGVDEITPQEALELYERNWRHVDRASLSDEEAALIDLLSREIGGGRLLV